MNRGISRCLALNALGVSGSGKQKQGASQLDQSRDSKAQDMI